MCVEIDEAWEDIHHRIEPGICKNCGHEGPMSVADLIVADESGEAVFEDGRHELAIELLWNDGVPDWTRTMFMWGGETFADDDAEDARSEVEWELAADLAPPIVGSEVVCELCEEARRWLSDWCHSYIWNRYLDDIIDHWVEDEINRTYVMARLYVAARKKWVINGRRLSVEKVKRLVDDSLAELKAAKKLAGAR